MEEELIVDRVRSYSSGTPGRSLNSARTNHFVVDEPAYVGGPGEAITPAEAFLAGISACAVLLVENFARQRGVPLQRTEVSIEGTRLASAPADFQGVNMHFQIWGPDQAQAEQLVEAYKER